MSLEELKRSFAAFAQWMKEVGTGVITTPQGNFVCAWVQGEPMWDHEHIAGMPDTQQFLEDPEGRLRELRLAGGALHIYMHGNRVIEIRAQVRVSLEQFRENPEGLAEAINRSRGPGVLYVFRGEGQDEEYEVTIGTPEMEEQLAGLEGLVVNMVSWPDFRSDPDLYLAVIRAGGAQGRIMSRGHLAFLVVAVPLRKLAGRCLPAAEFPLRLAFCV